MEVRDGRAKGQVREGWRSPPLRPSSRAQEKGKAATAQRSTETPKTTPRREAPLRGKAHHQRRARGLSRTTHARCVTYSYAGTHHKALLSPAAPGTAVGTVSHTRERFPESTTTCSIEPYCRTTDEKTFRLLSIGRSYIHKRLLCHSHYLPRTWQLMSCDLPVGPFRGLMSLEGQADITHTQSISARRMT